MTLSKQERVQAVLEGETVDRPPMSVWRHFYDKETTTQGLVESMLGFQRQYDWDFMKVNPRAQYHVEDWGATFQYPADPNEGPTALDVPVGSPEQWDQIEPLKATMGVLGEHLMALSDIKKGLAGETPFIMTVFNPISIAGRLVESEGALVEQMRNQPDRIHSALEVITETFCNYTIEILNAGADGIFFATTSWATTNLITSEEYAEFGRPYDLRILDVAKDAWFNVLHVCRSHNMLRDLIDYPIQAFNWDTQDATNHSLEQARAFASKPLIGGISREALLNGQPGSVAGEVNEAIAQTDGRGLMLSSTCSISPRCPEANLEALRKSV